MDIDDAFLESRQEVRGQDLSERADVPAEYDVEAVPRDDVPDALRRAEGTAPEFHHYHWFSNRRDKSGFKKV